MNWKGLALYLADCVAATAELDDLLDPADRVQRNKFLSLKVSRILTNQEPFVENLFNDRDLDEVVRRLRDAAQ